MPKNQTIEQAGKGRIIWFTGLSGSGKTTLSTLLKKTLEDMGLPVFVLDGDRVRKGLNKDLGFSDEDRAESLKRARELAALLADSGMMVLAAFITPLENLRNEIRARFAPEDYVEVYVDCNLATCESRDPKGLYKKARSGKIKQFTGISSPFEAPSNPDISVPTSDRTPDESFKILISSLEGRFPEIRRAGEGSRMAKARPRATKLLVLGIDCAAAKLFFGSHRKYIPFINKIAEHGVYGELRSTDPPITVPAWTTITTGMDPGRLGLYGFRNRVSRDYSGMRVASAEDVSAPRVWDYLEKMGKRSVIVGLPHSYPPSPHSGVTIPGFPVGQVEGSFTYPSGLAHELSDLAEGEYMVDCPEFRSDNKAEILENLYAMVEARFNVAQRLITREKWDLFMMVEIALDRLHHAFWRYCVTDHPKYEPGNEYEQVMGEFYRFLDTKIAALLSLVTDDTYIMIVSDHGARNMVGGVRINQWLIENDYLRLKDYPNSQTPLDMDMIDWKNTMAWGEGGYYSRIFLNVKGREPKGIVEPGDYERVRDGLARALKEIRGQNGDEISNSVLYPERIYSETQGIPPDLLVYFDNLERRSTGAVGPGPIFSESNDTGPDDANHDHDGIFVLTKVADLRGGNVSGIRKNADCLDITPTILDFFGMSSSDQMRGKSLLSELKENGPRVALEEPEPYGAKEAQGAQKGFSTEEEEMVKEQLKNLGYI